ncbi:MAG: hypothetical protein CL575_13090 [Altererythrobacter sp.]|nr:hypothetical protein [Erythrobacter sp.]MAW91496.1 hypothetical protein [Altererythrobacter sp.]MBK63844.1 hypothetical protein [Altererythrobacter sp.]|tara:strand:+ start:178 stop:405 length:228 start_codon:yes stop_codon:yes gene_type:complete
MMKKAILAIAAAGGLFGTALVPTNVAAGTCELIFSEQYGSCNGDEICQQFAVWDYAACLEDDRPKETTNPLPVGG